MHSWHANCCDVFLVSPSVETFDDHTQNPCKKKHHAVITNRNQHWQGLEQDITTRVSSGSTYTVFARVGVSGMHLEKEANVIATLKLEYQQSETKYLFITKYVLSLSPIHFWINVINCNLLSFLILFIMHPTFISLCYNILLSSFQKKTFVFPCFFLLKTLYFEKSIYRIVALYLHIFFSYLDIIFWKIYITITMKIALY